MLVVHVITDLDVGGAEIMLLRLLGALRRYGSSQAVVSLMTPGPVGARIEALGVPVHSVGMRRGRMTPGEALRLARSVRALKPDLVQTWMYHGDLLGGLAARLAGARVVWAIHNSTLDEVTTSRVTRAVVAASACLSHLVPARIVSVSTVARDLHVAAGYAADRFVVIPNGFDLMALRPDADARKATRARLGVGDDAVVVGLVARVAPQKDHATFLRAAGLLAARLPRVRFVLSGDGATADNPTLGREIAAQHLANRVHLLGRSDDVPRLMNGLDVLALSSAFGEAFPLVVGEAMSCGVPCVVTDVGDSAFLVGDTGKVVPPRDPGALAAAIEDVARLGEDDRRRLGAAARARVEARFSLGSVADAYEALYRQVLGVEQASPVAGVSP